MLFDLRGRGRRRVISVIYVGLALLIGVGLVGFGIGGGLGGGGILSAANNNEGSGSASFAGKIKKYRKLTETQPNNPAGWEGLAKNLLHEAGGEGYTSSSGEITTKGKGLFKQASEAWTSYLALNPAKPNAELAQLVYAIYGEAGLNDPAKAVQALQIVVAARPESAAYYAQLAEFAYKAKNARIGDLASKKAVELAPSNEQARVKTELEEVKKHPNGGQTYVTTTNGKTYEVKKSPSGTFTGKQVSTAPPGAVTTTTPPTTTKK
jgi:tetratricopeptide (TPR) repeat protein